MASCNGVLLVWCLVVLLDCRGRVSCSPTPTPLTSTLTVSKSKVDASSNSTSSRITSTEATTNPASTQITSTETVTVQEETTQQLSTVIFPTSEALTISTEITSSSTRHPDIPEPNEPQIDISGSSVIILLDDLPPSVSYVYITSQSTSTSRRRRQETNPSDDQSAFIVANLTRSDVENGASNFTLGDNKIYGGYKNTPLEDGMEYTVRVGYARCTDRGCDVVWSNPTTFTAPVISAAKDSAVVGIIMGVLFTLIVLAVVIVIFIFWCKKNRSKKKYSAEKPQPKEAKVNEAFSDEEGFEEIELDDVIYNDIKSFKWDIFWSDLRLTKRVLGKGHFSEVRLGGVRIQDRWIKSAVKILRDGAPDYDNAKTEIHEEFKAMTKISLHPNVINVLGICEHKGNVYAALEFSPHGNLRKFLRENRKELTGENQVIRNKVSNLNSEQLINIAIGVAKGMEHLAQHGIIHRDLAARNILVGKNMTPKVANFAKPHGKVLTASQRDPIRWLSVESLQMRIYTGKSDAWSYGILLWEIATLGGTPYPEMETKFLNFHLNNGYRMPKPENCDSELYEMMKKCWKENPESRPSFKDIVFDLNLMASMKKNCILLEYEKGFKFVPVRPDRDNS
ncbi:uncharacterized protein [Amphiura filiformis]|uniref:uncharacterized protein n=1 Tax=Amphiura filiformis TaxID=82378 RepID=UPI003B20F719